MPYASPWINLGGITKKPDRLWRSFESDDLQFALQSPSRQLPGNMVTALYPLKAFTIYNPQAHFNLRHQDRPSTWGRFGDRRWGTGWSVAGLIRLTGADTGGDARLSVVHLAEDQG